MKYLFILNSMERKDQLDFMKMIVELKLTAFYGTTAEKWLDWTVSEVGGRQGGRLAIWFDISPYPACCGLKIISDPHYSFEFTQGSCTISNWNTMNEPEERMYATVKELKIGIARTIAGYIRQSGGFLIADKADGAYALVNFCNMMLPSNYFSVEKVLSWHNGNTRSILGLWFARNKRYIGDMYSRDADLSNLKEITGTDEHSV